MHVLLACRRGVDNKKPADMGKIIDMLEHTHLFIAFLGGDDLSIWQVLGIVSGEAHRHAIYGKRKTPIVCNN